MLDTIISKYKHLDPYSQQSVPAYGNDIISDSRDTQLPPKTQPSSVLRSASEDEKMFKTTTSSPKSSYKTAGEAHVSAPSLTLEQRDMEGMKEKLNDLLQSLPSGLPETELSIPKGDSQISKKMVENKTSSSNDIPEKTLADPRHTNRTSIEILADNAKTGLHAMER